MLSSQALIINNSNDCSVNHLLVFGSSGVTTNPFRRPAHILSHVPTHLGCSDARKVIQCFAEINYWSLVGMKLFPFGGLL